MLIELEEKDIERISLKILEGLRPLLRFSSKEKSQEEDIIFDIEELARYLKVNKTWIYERTHLNEIPYYKLGRFPRFRKGEIDQWLKTKKHIPVDSFPLTRVKISHK